MAEKRPIPPVCGKITNLRLSDASAEQLAIGKAGPAGPPLSAGSYRKSALQHRLQPDFDGLSLTVWGADFCLTRKIRGVVECRDRKEATLSPNTLLLTRMFPQAYS